MPAEPANADPAAAERHPQPHPARWRLTHGGVAMLLMCAAVVAVYVPVRGQPNDNIQFAGDSLYIHSRRIAFAQENLFQRGVLPAWYPRELLGTPFRANLQNFPLIPTRLVLLGLDPHHLFTAGSIQAAVLAAVFTFLYARAIGLGPLGAAAAGWTFACSGFYAARVLLGTLPLLEVYPALPLLLWLVELNLRNHRADGASGARRAAALGGLGVASLAEIDGRRADVPPADDTFLAVSLPPGRHVVRLSYHTPGAEVGAAISIVSLVLLAALVLFSARPSRSPS